MKDYLWLTAVALAASAYRLPDMWQDANGKTRWGMLLVQLPTAFATGVLAHAMTPALTHFFPYVGDFAADGLSGVLAFAGPLAVPKLIDALTDAVRTRLGGKT